MGAWAQSLRLWHPPSYGAERQTSLGHRFLFGARHFNLFPRADGRYTSTKRD